MNHRGLFVGLFVAAILASSGAILWGARASAAPEPTRLLTFRDSGGVNALTIEAHPDASEAGLFAFRVADGVYLGLERASIELVGHDRHLKVRYEGTADFVGAADATKADVRLLGEFDLLQHRGEARLWVGRPGPERGEFRIHTGRVDRAEAEQLLGDFEDAVLASDWTVLYALVSRELVDSITPSDFVASAAEQTQALGQVIELRREAVVEPHTNPAGITYVIATYTVVRASPSGGMAESTYDIYLVLDPDTWRVWFSAPR